MVLWKSNKEPKEREPDIEVKTLGSSDAAISNTEGDMDSETGVKRALKTRHLSMMALAGIIGPGLLIGAGNALSQGGPAALIIGFGVIGTLAFSIMQCLGEMTTLYPAGGSFLTLSSRFVNKPFAAVVGWNYFVVWVAVLANEYNVISSVLETWSDKVPLWGYFLIFWFAFLAFQMCGVAAYGEAEFWLALVKLLGLCAFFLFSIVYVSGGVKNRPAFGFHYWNDPGAWADGFRGVARVFIFCSTFYSGTESVAVAATETRNPGKAIPIAIRQVIWRILFIYMGSAIFFGITCPWDDPGLKGGQAKALQSPMTIAIRNAGWDAGYHLVNAFILVTCLSAINSSIYIGSRTVLYLAAEGCAPKFMAYTNKWGVPVFAIIFTNLFGCLALMNIKTGAAQAYSYIVNLSGVSVFIVWGGLALTHFRFRRALRLQNFTQLPYRFPLYPWNTWYSLIINLFLALVQGWTTFSPFSAGDFVDAYILLPVSALFYIAYALVTKQWKWHNPGSIDLTVGRRVDFDNDQSKPKWYQSF